MGIIHYRLLPTCTNTYMLRSIYVFVIHFLKLYRSMADGDYGSLLNEAYSMKG